VCRVLDDAPSEKRRPSADERLLTCGIFEASTHPTYSSFIEAAKWALVMLAMVAIAVVLKLGALVCRMIA
jgi:protein-S-isoprenylcysteine O-methyltransferase Ste14